jgi:hypothetical protein
MDLVADPEGVHRPNNPAPMPTPPVNIKYDGAEVKSILTKGETAYHCQMSDGTTKWIPKSVFNE